MRKDEKVTREQSLEAGAKLLVNFPFDRLGKEGTQDFIKNPKKYCDMFADMILGEQKIFPTETSHLRLIGKTTISATKAGPRMKQENQNLFYSVDGDFGNWNAQTVSKDTVEATAFVYEQMKNGTYGDIYGSFNKDLNLLEFETHEQIKEFVEKNPDLLHPKGYGTHFLFRNKKGERFIAYVYRDSVGDLSVNVDRFSYDGVWNAENAGRFVILATKNLESKS